MFFTICMIVYNLLMYSIQPYIWCRLLWRSKKLPGYRKKWLERYGFTNHQKKAIKSNGIMLHAVSLGETLAAIPLIQALRKNYPKYDITITSMTPSGIELAQSKFQNYQNTHCCYLPYDLPGSIKRFILKIQPKLVIIMETELWPNLINTLYQKNIPFILANARLSNRSFIKYKQIGKFTSLLIQKITLIAAQNKEDANRFINLGAKKHRLFITGNLKCDITLSQELLKKIKQLRNNWNKTRQTWIASSTHSGEEKLLLQAHKQLLTIFPNLLMILSPRHPERFINIIKITKQTGLSYIIKSKGINPSINTQVIINDTVGESMLLYGISDIAFIGGTLIQHGGHNPLEPAAHSIPIITGPYTFNFHNICNQLYKARGLITITNLTSLIATISMLLTDQKLRTKYGQNATTILQKNQGALQTLLKTLDNYLLL